MRVFLDTTVLVDIDRGKEDVIGLCKKLTLEHEAYLSTVTVSEILTGSYLRRDAPKASARARRVLRQFSWVNLDGTVAEKIAQLNAFLIAEGQPIEYQDQAIAASCLTVGSDVLLTDNVEHFSKIPPLRDKVLTPEQLSRRL